MKEQLKIDNQLCFPLYAASKEVVRKYQPLLKEFDLTYTQYIAMLVLFEKGDLTVSALGKKLYLDSGTLTPLLKKLKEKGYITSKRMENDERNVLISLTKEGSELEEKLSSIPFAVGSCIPLNEEESKELYRLLYKVLNSQKER